MDEAEPAPVEGAAPSMDESAAKGGNRANVIIATGTILAGLYLFRGVLTQLALALFLWFAVHSVSEAVRKRVPSALAGAAAWITALGICGVLGLVGYEATANARDILSQESVYEGRINQLIAQAYQAADVSAAAPTIGALLTSTNIGFLLRAFIGGLETISIDAVFVLIYLAFMFPAARRLRHKLDRIFPVSRVRENVREVLTAIRHSMGQYIRVQSLLAFIVGALTYLTALVLGLHNALLWGALALFLNFIPTFGPMISVAAPVVFALVQFQSLTSVAIVGGALAFWQLLIANFLQPRLMSQSLNLSALVVLLSLAFWSLLWGLVGAFLSAPLTVMTMIVLAQFPSSEWIAILLSEDGDPGRRRPAS